MSDILCGYSGDREAALMAYLYDEMGQEERAAFDRHIGSCARCRVELSGLGDVRQRLALWSPPDFNLSRRPAPLAIADPTPVPVPAARVPWWREMPAWAQVAAAMLVLGVSAGLANLDVHYDANGGLNIRTGWSKPAPVAQTTPADAAPWRAELAALEQQMRSEMHAASAATTVSPAVALPRSAAVVNDADIVRRVRSLVDESEKRQQRELALRVAEVMRDVNVRRDADLRKIDQNLGIMLDRTGVEVMKNRQMIDMYLQRVSQRQ